MAKKPTTSRSSKAAPAAAGHTRAGRAHVDHGHAAHGGGGFGLADGMDYPAHEAMYGKFTSLVKWAIVAMAVLMIFLFIVVHPMVQPPAS